MTLLTTSNSFNLTEDIRFEDYLTEVSYYHHFPYSSCSLGYNDISRFGIDQQNTYIYIADSYLCFKGKIENYDKTTTFLDYNGLSYLFSEMSYNLNGIEIEQIRNVGATTSLKSILLRTPNNDIYYNNYGMELDLPTKKSQYNYNLDSNGNFYVEIPFQHYFSFASDYKKPILNVKHELIIKRDSSDDNVLYYVPSTTTTPTPTAATVGEQKKEETETQADDGKTLPRVTILTLSWKVPYIKVNDQIKAWYLKALKNDLSITIPFRCWTLFENPSIPQTTEVNWNIKMVNNADRLLYLVVGFQTDVKNTITKSMAKYVNLNMRNMKVYLNARYTPYEVQNCNFKDFNYSQFYEEFIKFEPVINKSTRLHMNPTPQINKEQYYKSFPLFVLNLSYRDIAIKNGVSELKLNFQTNATIPNKTTCYALLVYETAYQYNAFSEVVQQLF